MVFVLILKLFCMCIGIGQINILILGTGVLAMEKGDTSMEWGKIRKNPVMLNVNWRYEFELIF